MSERTIAGGAIKVPNIFRVVEIIQPAKIKIMAPDNSEHEMVVDIKLYTQEEFYKSIEEFKTMEIKPQGDSNGSR